LARNASHENENLEAEKEGIMNDMNIVAINGRLTKDAELKYTSGGMAIATLSLASNRSVKKNDKWEDEANFFDCTMFGKSAEAVKQYLTNCTARNFRPTLKQVQSAIKRGDVSTGWSCDDLKEMVQRFGYTVVDNPDNVSKAQVVTV